MKKAYTWLLFDADGTLFDFDSAEAQALDLTLTEAGDQLGPEELEAYRQVFKRINGDLWRMFEDGGISQDTLKVARFANLLDETTLSGDPEAMSEKYLANLALNSDLLPGAEPVLEALVADFKMAIITNGRLYEGKQLGAKTMEDAICVFDGKWKLVANPWRSRRRGACRSATCGSTPSSDVAAA